MANIELYDQHNIDTLSWPNTEDGKCAKGFLLPLVNEGTQQYIKNVQTVLKVLKVDDFVLPITINDTEYHNSYVVSFYSIIGLLEEKIAKKKQHWSNALLKKGLSVFGLLLKLLKINKVVIVNNWLFSTSLNPLLSKEQLDAITHFLTKRFPEHVIVFRSINEYSDKSLLSSLRESGYHLINIRDVFFYDPNFHNVWSKRDCKRDLRMLGESGYQIINADQFSSIDAMRGLDLYRSLYIDKYTQYSPQFTEKFIKILLENRFLDLKGLKKNDKVDGIAGFFKMYQHMIVPFFGYDTSQSIEAGLYRMTNILGVDEARKSNFVLNQSSGASDFKKVRGLMPYKEYNAIQSSHLSFFRKFFWHGMKVVNNSVIHRLTKKANL